MEVDLKGKEDGLELIQEPGYKLEDLQKYIKESCLAEKCDFLNEAENDVENICKGFLALLNDELNLDQITTLFVATSMTYFIKASPGNMEWRTHLLQKTFRYVDTLNPIHLHLATKRLWEGLKFEDTTFVFNMLTICNQIVVANESGRAIGICLIWAIIGAITESDMEMFCFRKFSDLTKMLQDTDDELLQQEESTQIVYALVQSIGFLMNSIVFRDNEELKKAGYRSYFTYTRRDLEKLKDWAQQLSDALKVSVRKTNNFWDLRMTINEYINLNIVAILREKIVDMQTQVKATLKY